jgi:1,4-dihydroxy-2-naphthoate polyprenyltransferase
MISSPWLRAARLQLYTIGFTPLLLGNVAAWYEYGNFSLSRFALSLLAGLAIHLVSAFTNDAADTVTDEANSSRTPFSGGSGVVVEGMLTSAALIKGSAAAGLTALLLTCLAIYGWQVHPGILLFAGFGLVSAAGYSLSPLKCPTAAAASFWS